MDIPVMYQHEQEIRFKVIPLEDVNYVYTYKQNIIFGTADNKEYYLPLAFKEWVDLLKQEGFVATDRSFAVRKDRVKYVDSWNNAYFTDQPTSESKRIPVSGKNIPIFKNLFKK